MSIFQSEFAPKLIYILGIVNIISVLLVAFTCRCVPGMRFFSGRLMKYAVYARFYKYHCYIWWVFWISVIVHAVFAMGFYGYPF